MNYRAVLRYMGQVLSIEGLFMLPALLPILIHTHSRIRINKWVFYLYYPTHLILIYLLDQFVF